MSRDGDRPYTRTRKPEPPAGSEDWVIWAAWADRVSFEEIRERTGLSEDDVIRIMRRELKPASFRRWRRRAGGQGTKHRRRFAEQRSAQRKAPPLHTLDSAVFEGGVSDDGVRRGDAREDGVNGHGPGENDTGENDTR